MARQQREHAREADRADYRALERQWKEKERLRKFELTRVRSRATVAGRGRGRPPLTDEVLAERRRVEQLRAWERRRTALPPGDEEWHVRYERAHFAARTLRTSEALQALAAVCEENRASTFAFCGKGAKWIVAAFDEVERLQRVQSACQCEGLTQMGTRCKLTSLHRGRNAAPLRLGGTRCVHHQPEKFTGTQCEGQTKEGRRCRVFSGSGYAVAEPLRRGAKFCTWHARQARPRVQCEAITKKGARCRISSWHDHPGGEPLRAGGTLCAKHARCRDS